MANMSEIRLFPASLRFPANCVPGAYRANDTRSSWVLLDSSAFVLDRRNSTTATCKFMDDKDLQVTFVLASPPNVSYFCLYCRGLKLRHYASEPKILATEADLALIRIVIVRGSSDEYYFIYRAAGEGETPSLEQLPCPSPYLWKNPLGILKYDTGYVIVSLGDGRSSRLRGVSRGQFEVYLFDSKDKVWTSKPVVLPRIDLVDHAISNVITIGGKRGTMAFVDLWRGILLYDVLAKDPLLRHIPLPETVCSSEVFTSIYPSLYRDITVFRDKIKYVEMGFKTTTDTGLTCQMIATFSRPATCSQQDIWHRDGMIDASHISDDNNILSPEILRMLKDEERMDLEPTMETLRSTNPTLCLHDEDIVYFLTKFQPTSKMACVVAVSMTRGSVEAVSRFGAERTFGSNFTFIKSRISSYLNIAPDTEGAGLKKGKKGKNGHGKG